MIEYNLYINNYINSFYIKNSFVMASDSFVFKNYDMFITFLAEHAPGVGAS